ncbi:MAG: hotdog fold thioesterase [Bacteroidetes bacterium]|nr:hotdog fold thioesterase [Bacteroidota bacterium]MBU1373462.1 hotdog fold thioesterase [Bacteroidota bacterium]MBU1485220.1 hotdog fold thioesterase [Bacteroidota bacterium]MBU1761411.1 hotdog fold thioesterase [Bacteroidota bacterium]MBU2045484.1 hotdog fold thioesterase [Bacteroidota bacterium]
MIWFSKPDLAELNGRPKNHIGALLGIEFTEIGDDYIKGRMPVDERTHQPFGILHGGASVVLTETLGSVASNMVLNPERNMGVGLEVNANHLRPIKEGWVTGICTPIHIGGKTHIWDIKLYNDAGKMTCISRLTVAVVSAVIK